MTEPMVSAGVKTHRQLLYELPYNEDILHTFSSTAHCCVCTIPGTRNDYLCLQNSLICLYKGEIKPLETKYNLQCSVSTVSRAAWSHDCTISIPVPSQAVFSKHRSTRTSLRILREIVKQKHNRFKIKAKVKWSHYRPGVAQRVGRGTALLFHDRGTRRGWVVSSTPQPHFTRGKNPVPILQEGGWAPAPVWTGGKSRSHRDSIPGPSNSFKIPKQIPNIPGDITVIFDRQLPGLEQSTNCLYCCLVSKRCLYLRFPLDINKNYFRCYSMEETLGHEGHETGLFSMRSFCIDIYCYTRFHRTNIQYLRQKN